MSQLGLDWGQWKVVCIVTAVPSQWSDLPMYVSCLVNDHHSKRVWWQDRKLWIMTNAITRYKSMWFYLWGTLKSKVYMNNLHSLEELKTYRHEIGAISENELLRIAGHVFRRCVTCQVAHGRHFEHELWIWYVHHNVVLTANEVSKSSACGSAITYESVALSAIRSLVLGGSPGSNNGLNNRIHAAYGPHLQ